MNRPIKPTLSAPLTGPSSAPLTGSLSTPVGGSLSEHSSALRNPGPARPVPTRPYPGEKETGKGTTFLNGNTFRSAVRAEDARANARQQEEAA
jgi:hypothetical protein